MARLRPLLHQGYLQNDPKIATVRGITFKPQLMGGTIGGAMGATAKAEAQKLKDLGLNIARIDFWGTNIEEYLTTMWSLGIKTILLTQYPVGPPQPANWWHYDPFTADPDSDGVEDPDIVVANWKAMLDDPNKPFAKYADDQRVWGFEIIGEPLIGSNHYSYMNEVGQYAQSRTSHEVFASFDALSQVQPMLASGSLICYHYYHMADLRTGQTIVNVTDTLRNYIVSFKSYGKPVLIGETGFPTYLRSPSNSGNTPYQIATINATTPETEALQYDYYANVLHIIKDTGILGFVIYQWTDDLAGGEGGFGMKTTYPELRTKPALELLATTTTPRKYVFSQWQDGDTNPTKTVVL